MSLSEQVRVFKQGDKVMLRSSFSAEQDVVLLIGKGTNRQINFFQTHLVPVAAPFDEAGIKQGVLIHGCGDDAAPWHLNSTYIGGNHGCSDVREVQSPGHGLSVRDIGGAWLDGAGTQFYVIKIVDPDKFWVLSRNKGVDPIWKFTNKLVGQTMTNASSSATLTVTGTGMVQLRPACRIACQKYLLDGQTPLAEGVSVTADFLEIQEEYDIINPGALLADILQNHGREPDWTGKHIAAVVRNRIAYCFYPRGAVVVNYKAQALQDFNIGYMGFIQSSKLRQGAFAAHEYFIPKTKPFRQDGIDYDFSAFQDYTIKLPAPLRFDIGSPALAAPDRLPDRFMQFIGDKQDGRTIRKVGYVLGYSLVEGLTIPEERARHARSGLTLFTTSKSYPKAIDDQVGKPVKAGTEFHCVAYRQYFDPAAFPGASAVYWHPEGAQLVLYIHFHQAADHACIRLPAGLSGRQLSVVEQSPGMTLHSGAKVPDEGLIVSSGAEGGYLVLKLAM